MTTPSKSVTQLALIELYFARAELAAAGLSSKPTIQALKHLKLAISDLEKLADVPKKKVNANQSAIA